MTISIHCIYRLIYQKILIFGIYQPLFPMDESDQLIEESFSRRAGHRSIITISDGAQCSRLTLWFPLSESITESNALFHGNCRKVSLHLNEQIGVVTGAFAAELAGELGKRHI